VNALAGDLDGGLNAAGGPDPARGLRRLVLRDCLPVAGYVLLLTAAGTADSSAAAPWLPAVSALAAALPVTVRRLWPRTVYLVSLGVTVLAVLCGALWDPCLPAAFALYTVARESEGRSWWERWLPGLSLLPLATAALLAPRGRRSAYVWLDGPGQLLLGAAALLVAWELGRALRQRRLYAARSARELAERLAERAVTEERLRIARELHDVVTHGMGLIAVKASVANHVARSRPEEAQDALRVIEATSREALTELRHMLGVLRADASLGVAESQPAAMLPAPGPDALPALVARARAAGPEVELTVRGRTEGLPEGLGSAVHRIVQEALTNVVRHAGRPVRCEVLVEAEDEVVRIAVSDDGRGAAQRIGERPSDGHGLTGMRERVALYGGDFDAGPRPGGGFMVSARLPYAANRQAGMV
jgi:signal transduction histidine kinase